MTEIKKQKASGKIRYYKNENGPEIGVTQQQVICEDGLYFRDINGDGKLNTYKDWRKSPKERAKATAQSCLQTENQSQLFLSSWKAGEFGLGK